MKKYEYVISDGSCNGEEEQFAEFVRKNYPECEVSVRSVMCSYVVDLETGENVDEELIFNGDLWSKYC